MKSSACRAGWQDSPPKAGLSRQSNRFARVTEADLRLTLPRLSPAERSTFVALRFLCDGWPEPPRLKAPKVAELAGLPLRSCQLALARLIDRGVVRRDGAASDPRGCRYELTPSCDQFDRSSYDQFDRSRPPDTLLGSRSIKPRSLPPPPLPAETEPAKPAVAALTDGGKVIGFVDRLTAKCVAAAFGPAWSDGVYVRRCLSRLVAAGVELPDGENLARFVRWQMENTSASEAKYPPGVVFTPERLSAWQARFRKAPPKTKRETPPEIEHTIPMAEGARRLLAALRGGER